MDSRKEFRKALDTSVIILDGGLATELERKGLDISTPLWSAEIIQKNPVLIEEVHLDYFKAGADVAITSSYQGSVVGLQKHLSLSSDEARSIVKKSVAIAKNAIRLAREQGIARKLFVAGSVGPYGAYLADGSEYRGEYSIPHAEMLEFHRPRIEALVEAGSDILAFETIPSSAETIALLELIRDFPTLDCWISFTMRDDQHISDGTSLAQIMPLINGCDQVVAVGINCVPELDANSFLSAMRKHTTKPLVVYPNSGEEYDAGTKTWSGSKSGGMETQDKAREWYASGARIIGGCCRTTPDSIHAISKAFQHNHNLS